MRTISTANDRIGFRVLVGDNKPRRAGTSNVTLRRCGLSEAVLENAATILDDILTLEKHGRSAIAKEAKIDETIMEDFFLFHLEEVPECLPEMVRTDATNEAFVDALKLVGVAIYEDDKAAFQIVLDYGYGRDYSDQLLAVKLGPDRVIWEVNHES